jgi:hypothetical protein
MYCRGGRLDYYISSFPLFYISVRLGSKHNIRASILASSLCLDSASMRGGSVKGPGSLISASVVNGERGGVGGGGGGGGPSLVVHSSSGVSSGSTGSRLVYLFCHSNVFVLFIISSGT